MRMLGSLIKFRYNWRYACGRWLAVVAAHGVVTRRSKIRSSSGKMKRILFLPDPRRLGRDVRGCTTRRWGDLSQTVCSDNGLRDVPWQTVAQKKDERNALEHIFVQPGLRISAQVQVPHRRRMIGETP